MQISNNYQPNFKSGKITKNANELLSKRMKSGEFIAFQDEFSKLYKNSKFSVLIDTADTDKTRLDAMISYNNNKKIPENDAFFRYIEEGLWASIFRSPKKFFEKVHDIYQKAAVPFENNGFKRVD